MLTRKYFWNSGEVFALTVGEKLHVVTSPKDFNNATLSSDAMLDELLGPFGVDAAITQNLRQIPQSELAREN